MKYPALVFAFSSCFASLPALAQKMGDLYLSANTTAALVVPLKNNLADDATRVRATLIQMDITGGVMLSSRVGLFAGVGAEGVFFNIKDKESTTGRRFEYDNNYMSFPLYLRYTMDRDRRVNFSALGGIKLAVLTDSRLSYFNNGAEAYRQYATSYMHGTLLYACLGAGANIALSNRTSIDAGLNFQASPIDVFNYDYEKDYYPLSIGVKLGINVRVSK